MKIQIRRWRMGAFFTLLCALLSTAIYQTDCLVANHAIRTPAAKASQASKQNKLAGPQIECMFSHGIADTYKQAHKYVYKYRDNNRIITNKRPTIVVPTRGFNYPDATQNFWRINFWRTDLGQQKDVLALKRALEIRQQQNPGVSFILYGVSRGASTILNLMANYPDTVPIKALVLESPFDHIKSVARHIAYRLHIDAIPYATDSIHTIINAIFVNYNKDGMSPIYNTLTIPKDIPILIICSQEDQLVPWHSSQALYEELKKAGHKNVHILILNKGLHAKLLSGAEGDRYYTAVHQFYKRYNLPHNSAL